MWSHNLMQASRTAHNDDLHPFGGCNRLLEQYQQIGAALLAYERRACGALIPVNRYASDFRYAVSFVPVEVLESYLDDLLDLGVTDESLFIKKPSVSRPALALLAISLVTVCYVFSIGHASSPVYAFPALLIGAFMAGIIGALYFLPRTKVLRRFSFATIVSREIASRRGHDEANVGNFAPRSLIRDLWNGQQGGRVANLPPHPARVSARYYH